MRHQLVYFAATLTAALALAAPAAAQNNGHMDGQWFSVQLKAKIALTTYGGTFNYATLEDVKLDTGRERCFLGLHWRGEDAFSYNALTVCQDAAGVWMVLGLCRVYELEEGPILSRICRLHLVAQGDRIAGPGERELVAEALLRFDASLDSEGMAKSVKYGGSKKVVVSRLDYTVAGGPNAVGSYGAGTGKLKLRYMDAKDVPAGAQAAFQAEIAPN